MTTEQPRHRAATTTPVRIVPAPRTGWAHRNALAIGTTGLALVAFVLGWAYRFPELTRPVPRPGARTYSLVQQIDAAGPVWLLLFWVVGGFLLTAVVWPRRLGDLAHGLAAGVHGMFAAAVWIGWALSEPRPPLVSAMLATSLVIVHPVFALLYSGRR